MAPCLMARFFSISLSNSEIRASTLESAVAMRVCSEIGGSPNTNFSMADLSSRGILAVRTSFFISRCLKSNCYVSAVR